MSLSLAEEQILPSAHSILSQTLLVYYIEERLGFNDRDIATLFLISGVLGIVVQGAVLKVLNDCFGERKVVMLAFALGTVTNLFYGLADHKWMIFVGIGISAFVGMAFPTISAIKANNVVSSCMGETKR